MTLRIVRDDLDWNWDEKCALFSLRNSDFGALLEIGVVYNGIKMFFYTVRNVRSPKIGLNFGPVVSQGRVDGQVDGRDGLASVVLVDET